MIGKIENKVKVKELRSIDPNKPASTIARQIGISRERVRQILIELNLPTKFQTPTLCSKCGKKLKWGKKPGGPLFCKTCRSENYHNKHTTKIICPYCNRQFTRENSYIKRSLKLGQKFFCSYSCRSFSVWRELKKNNGWN